MLFFGAYEIQINRIRFLNNINMINLYIVPVDLQARHITWPKSYIHKARFTLPITSTR